MILGFITGIILVGLVLGFGYWAVVSFDDNNSTKGLIAVILTIVSVLTFLVVPFSFHTVDAGEVAVVKRLGKITGIREAGMHFDVWMFNKYQKYDTKVREVEIEDMAYSSDAQQMTLKVKFQYQIMGDKVTDISKSYGSLGVLERRIQAVVVEKTKAALASYTAMDIIASRAELSPKVSKFVEESLDDEYHTNVINVAITNIDFSDVFEKAVEDKMVAEQQKLKVEYDSEAKVVAAEAQAKANELLEQSLTDKTLQKLWIDKWDGHLPQVVSDGNTMYQIPSAQ